MKNTIGNFLTQPNKDFPFDCETLDYIQTNQALLSVLGNIVGNKTILSGCIPTSDGSTRSPGYVFLKTVNFPEGEILYFEGGNTSGLYLKTDIIPISAQGYDYPQAYTVRSLAAGIGSENYNWNDFSNFKTNTELENHSKSQDAIIATLTPPPLGIVQMWAGDITGGAIPANYALCDGAQLLVSQYSELYAVIGRLHTPSNVPSGYFKLPDLRSRFIVGYNPTDNDYNTIAKIGGSKVHILTEQEMPSHTHTQNLHPLGSDRWKGGGDASFPDGTSNHDALIPYGSTHSTGGNQAHENRPPYYTLAYIIRTK